VTRFEEDANGREASFRVGELFEILLPETRTTGFKWVVEKGGEPVCAWVNESADAPPRPPGRAGTHLWQFRTAQAGMATILLQYRRPWESGAEPGRVFQMQIRVAE
jgi:predicted secreted protein